MNQGQTAKFCSLTYRSASGELARHTLLLNVNMLQAYKKDQMRLQGLVKRSEGVEREAAEELLKSINESIEKGIGSNSKFTQKGKREAVGKNISKSKETSKSYIRAFSRQKKTLEPGKDKKESKNPVVKAKNKIRESLLRTGKIRMFSIDESLFSVVKDGQTINIQPLS